MQLEFPKKEELRQFLNQSYTSLNPFSIVISPLITMMERSLISKRTLPLGEPIDDKVR